jgi:hypothetical protein
MITSRHMGLILTLKNIDNDHLSTANDWKDQEIGKVRKQMAELIGQDLNLRQKKKLLLPNPGICMLTIASILAELYNLDKFNHIRELVAFIGLASEEIISGSSIKGYIRIGQAGKDQGPYRWLLGGI